MLGLPKKPLQRYFFKYHVSVTWKQIGATIGLCEEGKPVPKGVTAQDVLSIKRALEAFRSREHKTTVAAVRAEAALLETAANMGDYAAVALLCGSRMSEPEPDQDDVQAGSKLLRELMDKKFPLAFKVSADLAYKTGHLKEARKFYELAIKHGISDVQQRAECYRSIGHLAFAEKDLLGAQTAFSAACQTSKDLNQVADCHFYLAQLREANREAARRHLEMAASTGLNDAFVPLGLLLLDYFNEPRLAAEYFQLGMITDRTGVAAVGFLDAAARMNDVRRFKKALAAIKVSENAEEILRSRKHLLDKFTSKLEMASSKTQMSSSFDTDRWSF